MKISYRGGKGKRLVKEGIGIILFHVAGLGPQESKAHFPMTGVRVNFVNSKVKGRLQELKAHFSHAMHSGQL